MSAKPTLQSQPTALPTLFFTEMWERFSYYGMRALLVLYLVEAVTLPRGRALEVYATYTALVYLTPVLGGYLADRWLGQRRAILIGAVVMALGHFAMAFPALLYHGLGLLVIGNGFFKPNIATLLGGLYGHGDPRRDAGFTLFYMGINLGAFLAPLVTGGLAAAYGWHAGFAAAGVGMVIGLLVFLHGQRQLPLAPLSGQDGRVVGAVSLLAVVLITVGVPLWEGLAPLWQSLPWGRRAAVFIVLLLALGTLPTLLAGTRRRRRVKAGEALSREERQRVWAIAVMALFVVFFWMGFEQAGGTLNLFAAESTDRHLLGSEFPASYFQSLNPLFILLLAPLFSLLWSYWDTSRYRLSVVSKQGLGMVILGLGFVVMALAQQQAGLHGRVGPQWLALVYLLHTLGELVLSPIGLSMVTKLAPQRLAASMMGVWFTAMAVASYLAGTLESLLQASGIPLYWFLVTTSIGAGLLLLLVSPWLQRLMHGRA